MSRFILTPAAAADINGIWDYTAARWSPDQADSYTDDLRDACRALAAGLKTGRPVDVRAGYLKHGVGSHVIYYRKADSGLVIVRVLHGRMDAGRHL
jgi:toxin ParE1/3/4